MTDLYLGVHVPADVRDYATAIGPDADPVLQEMEAEATDEGFPIIGPAVGGWLSQLVRLTGARRVFEFGSGFGYSAVWFARALPEDGEIVLTDLDDGNIDRARSYLARAGVDDVATFEVGDAVDIAREYDGPFDIALIDAGKSQYVDAFETIRPQIPPGGAIVADNTMTAGTDDPDDVVDFRALSRLLADPSLSFEDLLALDELDVADSARPGTRGIHAYLQHVSSVTDFETTFLPLGDGVTVSVRRRDGERQ